MKTINLDCPCCGNNVRVCLDDDFNIISVECKCKNSKIKDIEFGFLKEGEIK